MSSFVPNTTVTILTESAAAVNEFDDPVDAYDPAATGVPAYVFEKDRRTFNPVDGRLTTVRITHVLMATGLVTKGDRLLDESTGITYAVEHVRTNTNPITAWPDRVELRVVDDQVLTGA